MLLPPTLPCLPASTVGQAECRVMQFGAYARSSSKVGESCGRAGLNLNKFNSKPYAQPSRHLRSKPQRYRFVHTVTCSAQTGH